MEKGTNCRPMTRLLDKVTEEMYSKSMNYSYIAQHVSTGQSLRQDLSLGLYEKRALYIWTLHIQERLSIAKK